MEPGQMRSRQGERWVKRAERIRDAFGLVLVLVLATYVLTSLLANHGWSAVIITAATSATSVVALTSSHAKHRFVRLRAVALGADDRAGRDRARSPTRASGSTSPR